MSFPEGSKVWSKLVLIGSVICIFCVLLAIFGVRLGAFNFRVASDMLESTFQASVAVLAVAIIIFIGEAQTRIKSGAAIVILLLPLIGIWFNKAPNPVLDENGKPSAPLNDISTDTQNPPLYEALVAIRPAGSNSLDYPDNAATLQAERFADISSINSLLSADDAFNKALDLVQQAGWELVYENRETGKIEAVSSTFFFNFKDDVVIRIQNQDAGSIIDIRSHSRIGKGDQGKNAERVRDFIATFKQAGI